MFNDTKNDTLILRPPNFQTRVLSIIILLSFITAVVGGAYIVSLEKDKIDSRKFTVSQALAHGNKEIMVPLFIVSLLATVLLNYIRGGERYLLIFRIIVTILIYTMMVSLIWITVEKDKATHFHIAGSIFTFITVYIFTIIYLFNKYLYGYNSNKILLDLNMVLLYCSFILLLVFGIFDESDKSEFNSIMFAGNENITIFLNFVPLLYLGFI
jgi:hypothetical protein